VRIFDEFFRYSDLPKTSVFEMDNSNYYDLDPHLLYFDIENHFILSQESVLDGDIQYEGMQT